jgi:hypothetical protein
MSTDDSMRDADIANGENPDEANRQPEDGPAPTEPEQPDRAENPETESVPTGDRQAGENRENDPPA